MLNSNNSNNNNNNNNNSIGSLEDFEISSPPSTRKKKKTRVNTDAMKEDDDDLDDDDSSDNDDGNGKKKKSASPLMKKLIARRKKKGKKKKRNYDHTTYVYEAHKRRMDNAHVILNFLPDNHLKPEYRVGLYKGCINDMRSHINAHELRMRIKKIKKRNTKKQSDSKKQKEGDDVDGELDTDGIIQDTYIGFKALCSNHGKFEEDGAQKIVCKAKIYYQLLFKTEEEKTYQLTKYVDHSNQCKENTIKWKRKACTRVGGRS